MGDLKTENTSYPTTLDTATLIADTTDEAVAAHVNGPVSAIVAIETELGTDVAGTATDLATRLGINIHADGGILRGTSFPVSPSSTPHIFWRTDLKQLYLYDSALAQYQRIDSTNDHGGLDGLTDDDHTQYVHNTTARTITAQHTFAPSTTQAPFALGANAQGQKVTGLNAEKVDGYDASTTPTASTVVVAGAGGTLDLGWLPTTLTGKSADKVDGYDASTTPGATTIPVTDSSSILNVTGVTGKHESSIPFESYRYSTTSSGAGGIWAYKSRGTIASPSAVQSGDQLGGILVSAYGATSFSGGSRTRVMAYAAENWTDAAQGAYLSFWVTTAGGTSTAEKMKLADDGTLTVGGNTVGLDGSCFLAYRSTNQSVTSATATKVQINAVSFDVNSIVDTTTNYRVTPTIAGKYLFWGALGIYGGADAPTAGQVALYKNGSAYYYEPYQTTFNTLPSGWGASTLYTGRILLHPQLVSMNGSTDYVELWGRVDDSTGGAAFYGGSVASSPTTYLMGCRVGQ